MRTRYPAKKGRFARAVCANQGDRLSLIDVEAHVAHRMQQSVPNIQRANGKQTHWMPPPK
jgi:hypothetical protein